MYGSIHFGGKDVLRAENKPWPIRVGKFFFFFFVPALLVFRTINNYLVIAFELKKFY